MVLVGKSIDFGGQVLMEQSGVRRRTKALQGVPQLNQGGQLNVNFSGLQVEQLLGEEVTRIRSCREAHRSGNRKFKLCEESSCCFEDHGWASFEGDALEAILHRGSRRRHRAKEVPYAFLWASWTPHFIPAGNKGGGREETLLGECIGAVLGCANHVAKRKMQGRLCVRRQRRCGQSTYETF